VDFDWHPATGELWALDHGGDGLGDNEPPEEINIIHDGGDYGWPDCVADKREARTPNGTTWGPGARPERCGETLGPELQMQAHSAPLGLSFYTGEMFPASWKNDVLVGFHGSWNRSRPTGYKILRVRASTGRATGSDDFLWGFLDDDARTTSGRPVHAITGVDGAVYVSDDMTGNIYRAVYTGPRINPDGAMRVGDRIYELYGRDFMNEGGWVTLSANGLAAELLHTSQHQVNFVLPEGLIGEVTLRIENERAADVLVIQVE
jgi:glucose/arabinose dehydrogenase